MLNRLIQQPRLWASEQPRRASWTELFFDLIFVAAVAQTGEHLYEDYTLGGLLHYAFFFVLIWSAWNGATLYLSRFQCDDAINRVITVGQTFLVALMAANAKEPLQSESAAGFGAAYAGMRFMLAVQYWRVRHIRRARGLAVATSAGLAFASTLWLASALVPAPFRYVLWSVALFADLITPALTQEHAFQVPPDAHHYPERVGLFTIVLFGEFVAALMRGMESAETFTFGAVFAALAGLTFAFQLRWWYFDGTRAAHNREIRTQSQVNLFRMWSIAHVPLLIGIGAAGIGFRKLIRIEDETRLDNTEAMLLCGSAAMVMMMLTAVEATSEGHMTSPAAGFWLSLQIMVAAVTGVFGIGADRLPLAAVAGFLTAACAVQVLAAYRIRKTASGDHATHRVRIDLDTAACTTSSLKSRQEI